MKLLIARCMMWLTALSIGPAYASDLEELASRLQIPAVSRGEFTQLREISFLPQPLRSSGLFVHVLGAGLYWHVLTPVDSELRVRDGKVQERLGGMESAWSEPLMGAQGSAIAARVLTGLLAADAALLAEYFDAEPVLDGDAWQLDLVPKEAALRQMLPQVRVYGAKQVERLELLGRDGERSLIELNYDDQAELTEQERQILLE